MMILGERICWERRSSFSDGKAGRPMHGESEDSEPKAMNSVLQDEQYSNRRKLPKF